MNTQNRCAVPLIQTL